MSTPLYFQWQNPSLVKTIYPLREMKLRDFLYFYQEIDLWKAYKHKSLSDLQDDIRAHHEAQAKMVREAVDNFTKYREYFLMPDVRQVYMEKLGGVDETELQKINLIHAAFVKYFPKLTDPRKEKYFIATQLAAWEPRRKEVLTLIKQRTRRLNAIAPTHPTRPAVQAEIDQLTKIAIPMVDEEYDRLRNFLAAHAKLETRKLELTKGRAASLAEQKNLTNQLDTVQRRLTPLTTQHQDAANELARLKNPPTLAPIEAYFLTEDVSSTLRATYPTIDPTILAPINQVHKAIKDTFQFTKAIPARQTALKNHIFALQQELKNIEKQITDLERTLQNMGPTWKRRDEVTAQVQSLRATGRAALTAEISQLNAYWTALNATVLSPADQARLIQEKETAFAKLDQSLQQLTTEQSNLQDRLKALEADLSIPDQQKLLDAKPAQPLTLKDIVRGKLEAYKAELATQDHFTLLEAVVQRFIREPDRFPLWLQYMVIHFSGMRYKSAHGSWADPKDLLINLRTASLEKDFKQWDDATKDAILEQRLSAYGFIENPVSAEDAPPLPPPLARATTPAWKDKLTRHRRALQNPSEFHRRKSLFDLLADEINFEIETMTSEEVKEALQDLKDTLPAWMWKEIVSSTTLRVDQVEDANWEELDAKEQAEKNDFRWQEYRLMMSKWKENYATAWREEHNQSNQLIVTRAVCNETAEHIQHIRGNSPLGGLTAKPKWYMSLEKAAKPVSPGDKPAHFIIPRKAEDFTVGASVLWLRFVNEMPNPWRIAPPITLKSGEGLLPAQFFGGGVQEGGWMYQQASHVISRQRAQLDPNTKKTVTEQQYLRWIHEATVAEVAETADGPVVLTFETALPNEDKRLSSIGVFKHYLHNIVYKIQGEWFNASFIGYTPEGDVPSDNLEFMLDWNKILLKDILPPAELEAYKKKYFYRKFKAVTGYH